MITALGKTWHPEHFTCNHCNQELGTRNFFERDGHPYCEPDYHNLFSPRCAYCNGAILDVIFCLTYQHILINNFFVFVYSSEMCNCIRENVAYRALLLCSVWSGTREKDFPLLYFLNTFLHSTGIRRRWFPWTRWQAILSERLFRYVCTQVQWLQSSHYGKLHFCFELTMASRLFCLQGKLIKHFKSKIFLPCSKHCYEHFLGQS